MGKRILVIDDDEYIRSLLAEILITDGYEVDVAEDGRKGFEKAFSTQYDLITMDIRMPNWDGVETILGLCLVNTHLKFIVISGYLEDVKENLNKYPQIIKVLEKPIDISEFRVFIKKYFQGANK